MNSFIIGGDYVIPNGKYTEFDLVWGDFKDLISQKESFFINLEAPITSANTPIKKTGPAIKMDYDATKVLSPFNNIIASLANNHILDFSSKGIEDTLTILEQRGIRYFGAGRNLDEAKKPLITSKDGVDVAFINVCETEWCAATESTSGAYTLNIASLYHQVMELKNKVKYTVLIIHGGTEYYNLPSPKRQELYRLLLDFGYDAIVSHHTHCLSGYELYNGKPIIYGLGNLVFPTSNQSSSWNEGMFAVFTATHDSLDFNLVPFKFECNALRNLTDVETVCFNKRISNLNDIILDNIELEKRWNNFVEGQVSSILNYIIFPRVISYVIRKLGVRFSFYKMKFKLLNYLRCESHHDVLLTALKNGVKDSGK